MRDSQADIRKAKELLGYEPIVSFEDRHRANDRVVSRRWRDDNCLTSIPTFRRTVEMLVTNSKEFGSIVHSSAFASR